MDPIQLAILYHPDGDGNAQWDCPMCSLHIGPSDLVLVGDTIVEHIGICAPINQRS